MAPLGRAESLKQREAWGGSSIHAVELELRHVPVPDVQEGSNKATIGVATKPLDGDTSCHVRRGSRTIDYQANRRAATVAGQACGSDGQRLCRERRLPWERAIE
jgi:hypothetical protein